MHAAEPQDVAARGQLAIRAIASSIEQIRIVVSGDIDISTAPQLESVLAAQLGPHQAVLLDLREVDYIDSQGLSVLLEAISEAKIRGWHIGMHAELSPNVRRLMELTGVLPTLPLVADA